MLKLVDIRKDYVTASETVNALKGVNISFRRREFVSILGPSGCGKTTLLNLIGGLDTYTEGDLLIGERSTKSYTDRDWDVYRNHRIGFIFQSYNLIPHQTVLGNVELALTIAGIGREERIERAKRALDRVGLAGQYYKKPNQLSGGQCQRVAIARALVNDPEILLADEPTGALDTVTSVQIMDLIKEISGERLVIMVTHNPELAEKYSSRIVRLLDGNVLEDTNPMTDAEEKEETLEIEKEEKEADSDAAPADAAAASNEAEAPKKKTARKAREKAKMSFLTAFKLSARNLISKKGRTIMVGFAGSIGIIGIALVLAFSAGIKGYIASMQDDMLSGNPISITEKAYDLEALTTMMGDDNFLTGGSNANRTPGKVYISSLVEYLATMETMQNAVEMENEITPEYIEYIKSMDPNLYQALKLGYGLDLSYSVFADFKYSDDTDARNISVKAIIDTYTSLLKETEFADYADAIPMLIPQFNQAPNNSDYILSQYELVGEGSRVATGKNEIMLVLNANDELSDLLLAMLGYYTQEEFEEIVHKASGSEEHNEALYKEYFEYDELIGSSFVWYPNNSVYTKGVTSYSYQYDSGVDGFDKSGGEELTVVGILKPREGVSFGSLASGVYYTEALTNHILRVNRSSTIIRDVEANNAFGKILAMNMYKIEYSFSYTSWWHGTDADKIPEGANPPAGYDTFNGCTGSSYVGISMSIEDIIGSMAGGLGALGGSGSSGSGGSGGMTSVDLSDMKDRFVRALGGNNVPNSILIYPLSFDEMYKVTDYLDAWNDPEHTVIDEYGNEVKGIMIGNTVYTGERGHVEATNTIEIIVGLMNTMIDIVTYALVGFTSVSLVVSTVMIGIITYVSVVERVKEIGVIRSLGGRKRDVSHLFNAETFIIGLLAGLIGIGATYGISLIVNLILRPLIGYPSIAALPIGQAALLVLLSIGLTLISGLIPARSAANKDPVVALRTE